ncbi:hypothetical protein [Nocardioides sp.]|uniref:hypothetical protein n=1 Tax=Nocardioides sp. TaxID=35761 RepID=UPI0035132857
MRSPRSRLPLLLASGLLGVSTTLGLLPGLTAGGAQAIPSIPAVPGLPIPPGLTDALVPQFSGAPVAARPMAAPRVPQNPYLSANGTSSMHNDAYSTDAYEVAGPLGRDLQVTSASYGVRECATAAFDSRGHLIGLCGDLAGFTLMSLDPDTLAPIDEVQLSERDLLSGANPFSDICGGTYFFLDQRDRVYATTIGSRIAEVAVRPDGTLQRGRTWPLAGVVPADDCLVATTVDWNGLVWFVTQDARVGILDRRTGVARILALPRGEGIFNSVSSDETGAVYLVTTHALYRMDADRRGRPQVTWRQVYDRGSRKKPGMLSRGSGTSPTLLGKRWIAIADNADPRTSVIVYDRRRGVPAARREHCAVPTLPANAGTTENSLVAAGRSFIIENNYGYEGVQTTTLGRTTTPGIARVVLTRRGCRLAWTNDSIAPTSVAKASHGSGLLYAYTKPARSDGIDAWYVTAIDLRTGRTAWSRLTGTGIQWNNHYAAIYLGPDGTLYVATLAGMIRLADGG